jgi:hypothetical protein
MIRIINVIIILFSLLEVLAVRQEQVVGIGFLELHVGISCASVVDGATFYNIKSIYLLRQSLSLSLKSSSLLSVSHLREQSLVARRKNVSAICSYARFISSSSTADITLIN